MKAGLERALVILGPTASGKTALALAVAKKIPCEIISLDSALIYQGMDIGTAKPTLEEMALCPHHLIDIIDPRQSYSAANFAHDCTSLVKEIWHRGRLPVICGGTMMYYKALCDGISPLPVTDEKVRAKIAAQAQESGWPAMHEKLRNIDPVLYARLAPNDKQRISRALEVYAMTGRSMSSFYEEKGSKCPFLREEIVLLPDDGRESLRKIIKERFEIMLKSGFEDEVRRLKERGDLNLQMPSMRCVGYRQMWEYLDGILSYDEMRERSVIATCRLAKHQMTWLRGGLGDNKEVKRTMLIPRKKGNEEEALKIALRFLKNER